MTTPDQPRPAAFEIGPAMDPPDAAEILSNGPDSFGWAVLGERHPALIGQIRDAIPYEPKQRAQLDRLLHEITVGTIEPLPAGVARAAEWQAWTTGWIGRRWEDIGFLSAESYFYAKLLDAVDFWEPGNWRGIDPFEPMKSRELTSDDLDADLRALDTTEAPPAETRTRALILASLWGNQADLGFRIAAADRTDRVAVSHLVADDTETLLRAATGGGMSRLCVIADNAGRELAADLILIDHLLHAGMAASVDLHLKPHPYYVSDATTGDLVAVVRRLAAGPPGGCGCRGAPDRRTPAAAGCRSAPTGSTGHRSRSTACPPTCGTASGKPTSRSSRATSTTGASSVTTGGRRPPRSTA